MIAKFSHKLHILILTVALGACSSSTPVINSINTSGNGDCLNSLMDAQTHLTRGRLYQLRTSFYLIEDYSDAPINRPYHVVLAMSHSEAHKLMELEILRDTISNEILSNCNSVGLVTISVDNSGYFLNYGVMEDGSIKAFECLEHEPGKPKNLLWGQQFCDL